MHIANPYRSPASRGIALLTFAAALFLCVAAYPVIWHLATDNPNPSMDPELALILALAIACLITILGTISYAVALRRTPRISHQVRWRFCLLSAAIGIASPVTCFALAWCARHMPLRHLSDGQTVAFLLACSLITPFLLGLTLLRLALRKDWLYPTRTPGLCPHCRYNLTGNITGRCPECGTPIPAQAAQRRLPVAPGGRLLDD